MKQRLASVLAAAAVIGVATANTIAAKDLPASNWSGFYAGLSGGIAWGDQATALSASPGPCRPIFGICIIVPGGGSTATANGVPTSFGNRTTGGLVGGELGYNWQVKDVVFGLSTDFSWVHLKSTDTETTSAPVPAFPAIIFNGTGTVQQQLDTLGTLRARLGYTPIRPVLLYVTGGLAYGRVSSSASVTETTSLGLISFDTAAGSSSGYRAGWALGGGFEWQFASNLTLKTEYLHYDLGSDHYSLSTLSTTFPGVGPCCSANIAAQSDFQGDIARLGVNFLFR